MSSIPKFFVAFLPKKWAESVEAESRDWITRCPCGFERSLWEAGGIRWKGWGKEHLYFSCPHCGQAHWNVIYKKVSN